MRCRAIANAVVDVRLTLLACLCRRGQTVNHIVSIIPCRCRFKNLRDLARRVELILVVGKGRCASDVPESCQTIQSVVLISTGDVVRQRARSELVRRVVVEPEDGSHIIGQLCQTVHRIITVSDMTRSVSFMGITVLIA